MRRWCGGDGVSHPRVDREGSDVRHSGCLRGTEGQRPFPVFSERSSLLSRVNVAVEGQPPPDLLPSHPQYFREYASYLLVKIQRQVRFDWEEEGDGLFFVSRGRTSSYQLQTLAQRLRAK